MSHGVGIQLLGNIVTLMRHKVKKEIICILALLTIPKKLWGKVPKRISCSGIRYVEISTFKLGEAKHAKHKNTRVQNSKGNWGASTAQTQSL